MPIPDRHGCGRAAGAGPVLVAGGRTPLGRGIVGDLTKGAVERQDSSRSRARQTPRWPAGRSVSDAVGIVGLIDACQTFVD